MSSVCFIVINNGEVCLFINYITKYTASQQKCKITVQMHGIAWIMVISSDELLNWNTHASLLLFAGVSIASVARRLGHASMTTTQKTYLHIIQELENKDIDIVMRSLSELSWSSLVNKATDSHFETVRFSIPTRPVACVFVPADRTPCLRSYRRSS